MPRCGLATVASGAEDPSEHFRLGIAKCRLPIGSAAAVLAFSAHSNQNVSKRQPAQESQSAIGNRQSAIGNRQSAVAPGLSRRLPTLWALAIKSIRDAGGAGGSPGPASTRALATGPFDP